MFINKREKRYHKQRGRGFMKNTFGLIKALKTLPQRFPGEKHTVLLDKSGNWVRAAYAGPHTAIIKRVSQNIQPKTYIDGVSEIHDIDYEIADQETDVRKADIRFLEQLEKARKNKLDKRINIVQGKLAIKGKIGLERLGVPKRAFTSFGGNTRPGVRRKLENKREELVQQGYGKYCEEMKKVAEEEENKIPCQRLLESLTGHKPRTVRGSKLCKETHAKRSEEIPASIFSAIDRLKIN